MLGLCVTRRILVPAGGDVPASMRRAAARRLFSLGETTKPPSAISTVVETSPKPSSVPVSTARWKRLVWTLPTGILSLCSASPIDLASAPGVVELTLVGGILGVERIGIGLVRIGGAMAQHDDMAALLQRRNPRRRLCQRGQRPEQDKDQRKTRDT